MRLEGSEFTRNFLATSTGHLAACVYEIDCPNNVLGALCGEIFVAERFKELIGQKFEEKVADAIQRVTEDEWQDIMTRNWEQEIRNQFTGAARTWIVRLPYSLIGVHGPEPNGGRPTITITSEEVEEVFGPIVKRIESLVASQVEAAVMKYGKLPKVSSNLRTRMGIGGWM